MKTPLPFETYQDIISGTWSRKWAEFQLSFIPKHRIRHTEDKIFCTCGIGFFESVSVWAAHATKETKETK
jgi:hypothetical protein